MQVTCEGCGIVFEAKRRTRRFHSDTCQKRAKRGTPNVIAMPPRQAQVAGLVEEATRVELEGMDVVGSPLGALALALAGRIDVGNETGAATAALARELRATFERIEEKVPAPAGRVANMRLRLLERANSGA